MFRRKTQLLAVGRPVTTRPDSEPLDIVTARWITRNSLVALHYAAIERRVSDARAEL